MNPESEEEVTVTKERSMTVTLYRSDFKDAEDGSGDSLFESVLSDLRIPESKWDDIDMVEVKVDDFEAE